MKPRAYVVHHLPGRIRLRVPGAKGDRELLGRFRSLARSVEGVKTVDDNPLTSSVLIRYAPDLFGSFMSLFEAAAAAAGAFEIEDLTAIAEEVPSQSNTARAIMQSFGGLDETMRQATGNALDLKVAVPLAAFGAALLAMRRRSSTPLWLTLTVFGVTAFRAWHSQSPREQSPSQDEPAPQRDYLH